MKINIDKAALYKGSLDENEKEDFKNSMLIENINRSKILSIAVIIFELGLCIADITTLLLKVDNRFHFDLYFIMYVIMITVNIIFFAFVNNIKAGDFKDIKFSNRVERLLLCYITFIMLWGSTVSLMDQKLYGNLMVYIVNCITVSVVYYLDSKKLFIPYFLSTVILFIGLPFFQKSSDVLIGHYINLVIFIIISWLASRILYYNYMSEYKNKKLLEQSNKLLSKEIEENRIINSKLQKANKKLEKLSKIDDLTGISNRRGFNNYIDFVYKSNFNENETVSAIMIDIDYFKQYNDNYGHSAGDLVLKLIADEINSNARRSADFAARYGGEEFLVIAVNTDADGIAVINEKIPQPANDGPYYFKVSCPGKPVFVVRMPSQELANPVGQYSYYNYYNSSLSNSYWNYLYLDRGMYLPTDTVNAWGIVKSRNGSDEIQKAKLRLVSLNVDTSSPTAGILQEKEILLNGSGVFNTSIDFANLSSGSYEIKILTGDTEITSKSFQIKEYSKPAYTISLNPDKKAFFAWDTVNYGINANFYEGSPVPGLKLSYNYASGDNNKNGSLVCDTNGKTSVSLSTNISSKAWHPLTTSMLVNNAQAEDQEISVYNHLWLFTKDTMIEGKGICNGDKETFEVSTNLIDLNKIKDVNTYPENDTFRGAPVNTKVHTNIYEIQWGKKEVGEYYDFINKVNVKKYEYYQVKNLVKSLDFTTSNGKYRI
jgi:diguanylate cyclase (GGDEF)-like protein